MQTLKGKTLKGYEILEQLGEGGFGAVYKARQQSTFGREVAIKFIKPDRANQPEFIRRFESEAELIARLEHPHITPLIDYWRDPSGAYLVMRFLRGGSLRDGLEQGPYSPEETSRILDQIASALDLAHRHDVIHRDIKPDNIMLDEDGNAYLADFGIAKDLNVPRENQTQADAIVGSLDYISPEQARGEQVTGRTDIYSLGVTLYELLLGEHPFASVSPMEKFYKHINDPLPDVTGLADSVNNAINDIIQEATQKDPAHRFKDVLSLALTFRDAVGRTQTQDSMSIAEQLTMREHEILGLIADGLTNRQIAEKLVVETSTVKWHIAQLYKKLGVRSRVQAIVRAREINLILPGDTTADASAYQSSAISGLDLLPEPENPYKGLHAFQTADARDFFGREKLVTKLLESMNDGSHFERFLGVVGPSGSGKSSVVKAGLIPAIWNGGLPGSEKWFIVEVLPGQHPLQELEIALLRVAADQGHNIYDQLKRDERGLVRVAELLLPKDGSELVVVVDQFEEIFTQVDNEEARQHFLKLLHVAATDTRSRVRIIVTLRADYYDKPLHYPEIGEMLRDRVETILPLTAKELEQAITGPAKRVGVSFEPGLVAQMISEMNYQAGALPLMQYALTELFEQREKRTLTNAAYQKMGGAVGALANRADEIYRSFNNEAKELTRQVFLRLVTLGEGAEDTRRRANREELVSIAHIPGQDGHHGEDLMEEILDAFSSHRLLALDHDPGTRQPTVEVAHEAILREWEQLRGWLNESRDDIRQERIIALAAEAWKENGQDASYLLTGTRLEDVENWAESTELTLTPLEQSFIEASLYERKAQQKAEAERQAHEAELEQQAYNRLRTLVVVLLVASFFGIILTITAFVQRQNALDASAEAELERDNAEYAAAESLSVALAVSAEQAFDNDEQDLALALAIKANTIVDEPLPDVRRTLVDIAYAPGLRSVWADGTTDDYHPVTGNAMSPDGRYLITGEASRVREQQGIAPALIVWDAETGQEHLRLGTDDARHTSAIFGAAITPDSRYAITVGNFNEAFRWDIETGEMMNQYRLPEEGWMHQVEVAPDGQTMLTRSCTLGSAATGCTGEWVIYHWDIETGEIINTFPINSGVRIAFNPDGASFFHTVTPRETRGITKRNLEDGEVLFHYETSDWLVSIQPSPDGQLLAYGTTGNQIILIDAESGEIIREFDSQEIDNEIYDLSFSPDGRNLISGGEDGLLRIWDVESGAELERFRVGTTYVRGLEYTPDGKRAVVIERNGSIYTYDILPGNHRASYELEDVNAVWSLAPLSDGEHIAIGTGSLQINSVPEGNHIILYNLATNEELWRRSDHNGSMATILSPDEKAVLTSPRPTFSAGLDFPRLWDIQTGEEIHRFTNSLDVDTYSEAAAYTPDGKEIVLAADGLIQAFDAETYVETRRFVHGAGGIGFIVFSPDGRLMASSSYGFEATLRIWNYETGEEIQTFRDLAGFLNITFLPDNKRIIAGSFDGTLRIWDIETGAMLRQMEGIGLGRTWGTLNKDRTLALFSSAEDDVILLDLETGNEIAQFPGYSPLPVAVFGPDGQSVIVGGFNNILHVWNLPLQATDDVLQWISDNRAARELTEAECILYRLCEDSEEETPLDISQYATAIPVVPGPTATPPTDTSETKQAVVGDNRGMVQPGEMLDCGVFAPGDTCLDPGGQDVWVYRGQVGEQITIRVIPDRLIQPNTGIHAWLADEAFLPTLRFYDPDGHLQAYHQPDWSAFSNDGSWDVSIEGFEIASDGAYRIEVAGLYYYTGGEYTLTIESDSE